MVPVTPSIALALLAGAALGTGLWLLVSLAPRIGRPRLTTRLAPYLVDVSAEAREMTRPRSVDPLPIVGAVLAPLVAGLGRVLEGVLGGAPIIRTRLRQAGSTLTVDAHRARQLLGAAAGAVVGAVAGLIAGREGVGPIPIAAAGLVAGAIAGIGATDALLARAARRRVARMSEELPTVVEFLALSVSAGESILDALRRIATTGSGELAGELGRVVSRVDAGQPIARALAELRDELAMPAVARLVDQMLGALERGTPLADVLRAQALDAREESKRRILEAAGKREVAMLVPLVFLILPVTVLFAIWPGLMVLQLGL
ncbi:type II secretion system F family protein [Microcella alkalica]|uniref:type II secretion system F family protein n=1 Tax=Microcella alkalica TaxID=355930 RepID=UPI002948BDE9|nr:type II secretion system F family protein [Microcella alkalica]